MPMILKTNGAEVAIVGVPMLTADGCTVTVAKPVEVGESIVLTSDDGMLLRAYTVADYLRCIVEGCTIRLTNTPEPPPAPPPEPVEPEPTPSEINAQAIAELSMVQAQDQAVTQQALAELSIMIAGGAEGAV